MTTATKVRRRDLQSAVSKWIEERAPSDVVLVPPGFEYDTQASPVFGYWSIISSRMAQPRNTIPLVEGHIRIDLYWSRYDSNAPVLGQVKLKRGPELEDDVSDLFELENLPVFGLADWEAGSPTIAALVGSISSSDTSLTVTTVSGFPASGEVVIGSERIGYASITSATLNGLTRGLGETTPYAHATGKAVASELGEEIAMMKCEEADMRPLGWDVVAQRERTLAMIPFTVSYNGT
jgi:hypothetical protein